MERRNYGTPLPCSSPPLFFPAHTALSYCALPWNTEFATKSSQRVFIGVRPYFEAVLFANTKAIDTAQCCPAATAAMQLQLGAPGIMARRIPLLVWRGLNPMAPAPRSLRTSQMLLMERAVGCRFRLGENDPVDEAVKAACESLKRPYGPREQVLVRENA